MKQSKTSSYQHDLRIVYLEEEVDIHVMLTGENIAKQSQPES